MLGVLCLSEPELASGLLPCPKLNSQSIGGENTQHYRQKWLANVLGLFSSSLHGQNERSLFHVKSLSTCSGRFSLPAYWYLLKFGRRIPEFKLLIMQKGWMCAYLFFTTSVIVCLIHICICYIYFSDLYN